MAWSFVQEADSGAPSTLSSSAVSYGSAPTAGNLLVAIVYKGYTVGDTISVSDNVNGLWTQAVGAYYTTTYAEVQIWYFANAAGGSTTVTASFGKTVGNAGMMIAEYSGIATSSPLDQTAFHNGGTSTSVSSGATSTLAASGELVIGAMCNYFANTYSVGSGFTQRANYHSGSSVLFEDLSASSTSGQSMTASGSGTQDWGAVVAVFKLASGGSPVTKTQSAVSRIANTLTKTQSAVSRIVNNLTKTQPGTASVTIENYTYASVNMLGTDDSDLANKFLAADDISIGTDDSDYFTLAGTNTYNVVQFKYMNPNGNSTDQIALTYKGKSQKPTTSATAYLQIYNYNTSTWETLASDNSTAANTEFTLSATQSANSGNYYTSGNWVAVRIYQ